MISGTAMRAADVPPQTRRQAVSERQREGVKGTVEAAERKVGND
jgi:hypothetical protein